jgi:F-type H+-transporting ATPase subunit alpha
MQLSTTQISELIKSTLENISTSAEARTQGTVI